MKTARSNLFFLVLAGMTVIALTAFFTSKKTPAPRIELIERPAERRVDVLIDGELFTAYRYPERLAKPVLYPIRTARGQTVTRSYPMEAIAGERADHPHHVGHWLNYGDVNGLDFWNNSEAVPAERRHRYGSIHHREVVRATGDGLLEVTAEWRAPDGAVLLDERTRFQFAQQGDTRAITRTTTLTARDGPVTFEDNKEGFVALRVTRALELPAGSPVLLTDAEGKPMKEKVMNNDGVTGDYLSSTGLTGNDVWGTRAKWVQLHGIVDGAPVALAILDHPDNVGYPTYWHARGYGLFAANPLGQAVFSKGHETLHFRLGPRESVTFRYRILVHAGSSLDKEDLEGRWGAFAGEQ